MLFQTAIKFSSVQAGKFQLKVHNENVEKKNATLDMHKIYIL